MHPGEILSYNALKRSTHASRSQSVIYLFDVSVVGSMAGYSAYFPRRDRLTAAALRLKRLDEGAAVICTRLHNYDPKCLSGTPISL